MPRTSGNANHPLKLRLGFNQRRILTMALLLYKQHYEDRSYYAEEKSEVADLQLAVSQLTCQLGGCDYCTDDGPEITYGRED